jgi:hypothetical protein
MKAKKEEVIVGDVLQVQAQGLAADAVQHGLHIDPLTAKRAVSAGVAYVSERRAQLAKMCPSVDLEPIVALPALCDRFAIVSKDAHDSQRRKRSGSKPAADRLRAWRRKLLPVAMVLVANGTLRPDEVNALRAGHSTIDLVTDVLSLTTLLTPHRAMVDVALGESALAEAAALANATLESLGHQEPVDEAADLRDRYTTLLWQWHDRLRTLVALLSSYKEATDIVGPLTKHPHRKLASVPVAPEA